MLRKNMTTNEQNPRYVVVIPAYNEGETIDRVIKQTLEYSDNIIVVDDGSSDNTLSEIEKSNVEIIKHQDNQGKAASLWHGITSALKQDIDFIITLDGDGQHSAEHISLLIDMYQTHPGEIIIGARLADKSAIPAKRYYANKIANFWIAWAAGYPLSDSQSGFRLYPVKLFDNLSISTTKNDSFVFESEIIIKAAQLGIHSKPVAIPAIYAKGARASHFRGVRDITLITKMVGKSLFSRGLYLPGLYRSAIKPMLIPDDNNQTDLDGYLTILLSILVVLITSGISLILIWAYIIQVARRAPEDILLSTTIMVLGKELINDQPDQDYRARLQRVVSVVKRIVAKQIVILGGKTLEAEISEASAGRDYLLAQGMNGSNIILEQQSRNTLENLKRFRSVTDSKEQSVLLITNRYHLARSLIMAKGFGINAIACPAEDYFGFTISELLDTFKESFHLHWYLIGKYWSNITNNKKMLDRIS